MTRIKLCGLSAEEDIFAVNLILPQYVGFVFAPKSKRYVSPEEALNMKKLLDADICAVGVFSNENKEKVASLLNSGTIDMAQLHGDEDEAYMKQLRLLTRKPIIKAFRITDKESLTDAENSTADYILLDSGAGTGTVFNWSLLQHFNKPYFLAGGLTPENVSDAISQLQPYAVDVSSGIETNGKKDIEKMTAFVAAVRKNNQS